MTDNVKSRRGMKLGTVLVTKERRRLAEHAERTGNAPFTAHGARNIMSVTTMQAARDSIDRLLALGWVERAERPRYARNRDATADWYAFTKEGFVAVLGDVRAEAIISGKAPSSAIVFTMPNAAAFRDFNQSDADVTIVVSTGTLRIPFADVRKVYNALDVLVGRRSEG